MRVSLSWVAWFCIIVVIFLPIGLVLGLRSYSPETAVDNTRPVRVYLDQQGEVVKMPLEDYVRGVVAAEAPALFDLEALKAQAVATRTYIVRKLGSQGGEGSSYHPGADICDDPKHGQAYATPSQLIKRWGVLNYFSYWRRVAQAVNATAGQVLTYNGELIEAVYHSTSGDSTENSEDVWGRYVPYLRAVPCRWDKESPRYLQTVRIPVSRLERLLEVTLPKELQPRLGGRGLPSLTRRVAKPDSILIKSRTGAGRVREAVIDGRTLTGLELRQKLGLTSTNMTFKIDGDTVAVTTKGSGHGVGLCQYGANGLAKTGRKYRDILTYYFTGAEVVKLPSEAAPPDPAST